MTIPVKIFGTRGSEQLTKGIFEILQPKLPIHLGISKVSEFDNENLEVEVDNVRGHFIVVIHTHASPVNTKLIELFALLHAIKNAHPTDIMLVFAYMDYSRSDKKDKPRISAMAKVVAAIVTKVFGINKVLLLDSHSEQIKEYFEQANCPTADEVQVKYLWADYLEREIFSSQPRENFKLVFSDNGSADRFKDVPELFGLAQVYVDKYRDPKTGKVEIRGIVGDVNDKYCIVVDDEILAGGTAIAVAEALINKGAKKKGIYFLVVHAILSKKDVPSAEVVRRLDECPYINKIIVTDSVPLGDKLDGTKNFSVISVKGLLAESIRRTVVNESLTALYRLDLVPMYRVTE